MASKSRPGGSRAAHSSGSQEDAVPWRNMPPEWLAAALEALRHNEFVQGLLAFLAALLSAGIGAMAKIADEVKSGGRRKFFSAQLWLDVPAVIMVAVLTIGVAAAYDLPGPVAAGVSTLLGYAGPRIVDVWLAHKLRK